MWLALCLLSVSGRSSQFVLLQPSLGDAMVQGIHSLPDTPISPLIKLNDTYKKPLLKQSDSECAEFVASWKQRQNMCIFLPQRGLIWQTQSSHFSSGILCHELTWYRPCHLICIYSSQQQGRNAWHCWY